MADTDAPSLASIIEAVSAYEATDDESRTAIRVCILRNYTVEPMLPLFKYQLYQAGLRPEIRIGEYDNVRQEILDTASLVYQGKPDLVVITLILEHLDPLCLDAGWDPLPARQAILSMLEDLVARTSVPVIISTLLPPLYTENGIGASRDSGHRVAKVRELNERIREFAAARTSQIYVVDFEKIARVVGHEKSIDYRFFYMYRAPFRKEFAEICAAEIAKIARLLKGKLKKCLLLDCDNTLWGGVIGEDGLEGILLDPHEYPGRCFHEFQRSVLNLIAQGVVVALCSKNNEQDVFEVLDKHPHCLIKRTHLAAWRINWDNKAENIAALAQELNLGADSFVFVDDSAIECQLVRERLPEVTVLQVPKKIYDLPRLLYEQGLFDSLSTSAEDARRTQMYVAERERSELRNEFASTDDYLASLGIRAIIRHPADSELPRVAQLLVKTNQFNLTTRRYPESRVREMMQADDWAIYIMEAADRFSELGLIAVLIARKEAGLGYVDSLLMSCRALGRRLEEVFVDRCLEALDAEWHVAEWRAEYVATKKNQQVREFWSRAGFESLQSDDQHGDYAVASSRRPRPQIPFISVGKE